MLKPDSIATAVLLAALVAFGPITTDIYLPALPGLVKTFETDASRIQLTLSIFLAGYAFAQLLVGPLSDRFGRRPILIGGLVLYFFATLACIFAGTIGELITARFFQAIGACSGAVLGRAVVRDVYGANAAKVLAYIATTMATSLMVAPVFGGYLLKWFGWQSIFIVLVISNFCLFVLVYRYLQETNQHKNPNAVDLVHLLMNYRELLRNRLFVGYVLTNSFSYGGIFCFISGSSFVLIDFLGIEPTHYGLLFGCFVFGYINGTFLVSQLTQRLGIDKLIFAGCLTAASAGITMTVLALAGIVSVLAIIAPMYFFSLGVGLVMPNAMAGAVGPYPRMAGAASALLGFIQMGLAAFVSFAVGLFDNATQIPMTIGITLMGLLGLISFFRLVRSEKPHAN